MKKLEVEYGPFICIIIFYLILCIRFRKEFLKLSLSEELLTFSRDFFSYRSLLKLVFNILATKFCLDHLSTQPQTLFVFLQSERDSNNKQDKTKPCKYQSNKRL